jgi:hypothetical protein
MPKSMLLVGTESLETKKMMYGNKKKKMMMGGYNKDKRMGKAMGGPAFKSGSQPVYGGTIADAMPKGGPC